MKMGDISNSISPAERIDNQGASPMERMVLGNGLTLLTRKINYNDIVAVQALIRMGSCHEEDAQAGLAILLQNSLLKGTISRTSRQIHLELDSIGARLTVSSDRDFSGVTLLTTREDLDRALDIFLDVMLNPAFPEEGIEQEKELLIQNIKAREDQLLARAFDLFQEAFYGSHPYHKPSLGYTHTVEKFSRDDLWGFYRTYYKAGNMVISAVGNLEAERLARRFERPFSNGGEPAASEEAAKDELPSRGSPVEEFREKESQAAWIVMGFDAPSILSRDYPAMSVLDAVMGGSMASRLFVELRDKRGLAYQVGSSYGSKRGPSFFAVFIGTKHDQFGVARDGLLNEINRIKGEPVSPDELDRAKSYLKGNHIIRQERNAAQASLTAFAELMGLGHEFVDRFPQLIENVNAEDVMKAAKRYFGNYVLGAVLPHRPS